MKSDILKILKENKEKYVSGEEISNILGVTRASVWKNIKLLQKEGYTIDGVSKKGYKLINSPDILSFDEVSMYLNTNYIGKKIHHFITVDSTNSIAKDLAREGEAEGAIVLSEEQLKGRGRLKRSWISPKYKGIWMSIILRPEIEPIYASKITLIGAAAISKALLDMDIKNYIKWPNDIVINNKKVCGILTEMSAELNTVNYIVMGIGINVNIDKEEMNDDIKNNATSLKEYKGEWVDRKALFVSIVSHFEELYDQFKNYNSIEKTIEICKKNSIVLGKEIVLIKKSNKVVVKAIDIDKDGSLIVVHENGEKEKIISGEISLRGIDGYI